MSDDKEDIIEDIDESSGDIRRPFDPTKIDISVKPLIIDSLLKRMKKPMRIDLNTDFQRKGNLWAKREQSRLIESLLIRIPLPAFYFDGSDESNWKVVDGLQRLSSLKNFVIDKTLKLTDLEFLREYEGMRFDELPAFLQTRIEEAQINAYIINSSTPHDVKYNIFKRINTGGLVLKSQEIRHALNQGVPADFVKELAELEEFRKATDYNLVNDNRMLDRDFVMRFIAFYCNLESYNKKHDLETFLNDEMANLGKIGEEEREQIKSRFIKAMCIAYDIFEDDAFRKRYNKNNRRSNINKALFDSWSVNLAQLDNSEVEIIIKNKELLKERFITLLSNDKRFERSITTGTGDYSSVTKRFSSIKELVKGVIDDHSS